MNRNKIHKGIRTGAIVLLSLVVIAVLLHLTMNYLVPFIASMHNKSGAY